ncbi:hypothetical protein [uncultured Deinococcus sp.]|uniref:hypothetical protein n=1 Tax=uncultured Deinococcus sp. TaxID=158789 RepID=UPI0025CEC000|nr:hypothetical protein [uncultured Deinococcus sp.]
MASPLLRRAAKVLLAGVLAAPGHAATPLNPVLVRAPGEGLPYLLGAWQGGRWRPGDAALARELGAATYTRGTLSGPPARVPLGAPASMGDPCEPVFQAPLAAPRDARTFEVYTATPQWPRPVTALPLTSAAYREVVRQELVRRGVRAPVVTLTAVIRTDLDGNGTQEVIVEAGRYRGRSGNFPPPTGQPGDYSLLLLRHVVGGRAVTTVLGAHVAPATPWDPGSGDAMPLAVLSRLAGVADLNGDGRMEVLTSGTYYEGEAFAAHEWTPAGGLKLRLETGCGV